jgi:hypothetical protein
VQKAAPTPSQLSNGQHRISSAIHQFNWHKVLLSARSSRKMRNCSKFAMAVTIRSKKCAQSAFA